MTVKHSRKHWPLLAVAFMVAVCRPFPACLGAWRCRTASLDMWWGGLESCLAH